VLAGPKKAGKNTPPKTVELKEKYVVGTVDELKDGEMKVI
jgi:hypothetical protein